MECIKNLCCIESIFHYLQNIFQKNSIIDAKKCYYDRYFHSKSNMNKALQMINKLININKKRELTDYFQIDDRYIG